MAQRYEDHTAQCYVLVNKDSRYFRGFGKGNRVLTAHMLPGAKFYRTDDTSRIELVEEKLNRRGIPFKRVCISTMANHVRNRVSDFPPNAQSLETDMGVTFVGLSGGDSEGDYPTWVSSKMITTPYDPSDDPDLPF